jgi:hypothetical protein
MRNIYSRYFIPLASLAATTVVPLEFAVSSPVNGLYWT